jgi:hypothetical protein
MPWVKILGWRSLARWQRKDEGASLINSWTGGPYSPSVSLDQVFGDRQTDPAAAPGA